MKIQILLAALCIIFGITLASEKIVQASRKCIEQTNLTKAEFDAVMGHRPIETDNEKFKCYLKCYLTELHWMDDEGVLKLPPGIDIPQDEIDEAVPCLGVNGTDFCDKAFNFIKCDVEEAEKRGH